MKRTKHSNVFLKPLIHKVLHSVLLFRSQLKIGEKNMKNLEEKIEPVVIILDEEDDFDFEETEEEIQAEYEAECLADDTQDIINWINESNTLAEYVSMEFENMNKDDLGASLENASQCLDAIVGMLENGTLVLAGYPRKC